MQYLHSYVENALIGAAAETVMGAAGNITIPAGMRGVIRRVDAFYMGAGNSIVRLRVTNAAGAMLYGVARVGIGGFGGPCFVYVNAIAAAVVVVPTALNANATTNTGVAISAVAE